MVPEELGGTIQGPGGYAKGAENIDTATGSFATFASNIFGFLTTLAGIMFLLYLILGAMNWITAGGDNGKIEKARNQITNAATGLVIVVLAYSIAYIVGQVLGLNILEPGAVIKTLTPGGGATTPAGTVPPPPNSTIIRQ